MPSIDLDQSDRQVQWRCPYPDCAGFSLPIESSAVAVPVCPVCLRPFTPRSAVHFQEMQKKVRSNPQSPSIALPAASDLVVVIEDLRSLHNVGAVFRTADGAGFSAIYLCGITGLPPRKEIAKVSLGAEDFVPWQFRPFIAGCLQELKSANFCLVALEKNDNSEPLYRCLQEGKLRRPLALVVGNEVSGVSREAQYYCDQVCHLSMRGQKESLNVSVAFGAAAYLISEFFAFPEHTI
ncbi:MAG TPA: TrmH family RNA methyltransferase [Candidatus Obscuribacter sp.]|nr:TrmH family RNA methyltransferase [Candidatus Obscuribacter sp.]HNA74868.1 TrmH family RNA methyltransferase [Candidatus Obscuribacter sp.]HNB17339.1 TrmH family RNA methyltransferase [Candidatus Obscuribacter sp.]HND05631.1 TrmH family RNA methyltransferase [Candidatus Obscuribacter sp.]HND67065.1 TrmH family RNA methyltransferase [Candidatus Obscuribacter sp.]